MIDPLYFQTREEFRKWLSNNCQSHNGVWLLFSKSKDLKTLKASEALEEALCYGWIDGLMKNIDEISYIKYFSKRKKNSKWSLKNKKLAIDLEKRGLMSVYGIDKIEEAKKNGQWDNNKKIVEINEEKIEMISDLLKINEEAFKNFSSMPLSIKKTYTRAYLEAKTEITRQKRLAWMVDRLKRNLKPM